MADRRPHNRRRAACRRALRSVPRAASALGAAARRPASAPRLAAHRFRPAAQGFRPAGAPALALAAALLAAACAGAGRAPATPAGQPAAPAAPETAAAAGGAAAPAAPEAPAAGERLVAALPDTAAGRALGEWLAVYNRGDEAEVEGFVGGRFAPAFLDQLPVPALAAFHIQSRATTGELTPVEFVRADEHEIVALAAAANGGRMEVTIGVEPDPPHRLTALRLVPAETGGG